METGDSFQCNRTKVPDNGDREGLLPIFGELIFFKWTTAGV